MIFALTIVIATLLAVAIVGLFRWTDRHVEAFTAIVNMLVVTAATFAVFVVAWMIAMGILYGWDPAVWPDKAGT